MARLILIVSIVMLAAYASGAPHLPPGSSFPRYAEMDRRLNLTSSDRAQIARLVAAETSEPIKAVSQGENASKILVTCGRLNLMHPTPWMKGVAFVMQRRGTGWKITTRARVNIVPQKPTFSPLDKYR